MDETVSARPWQAVYICRFSDCISTARPLSTKYSRMIFHIDACNRPWVSHHVFLLVFPLCTTATLYFHSKWNKCLSFNFGFCSKAIPLHANRILCLSVSIYACNWLHEQHSEYLPNGIHFCFITNAFCPFSPFSLFSCRNCCRFSFTVFNSLYLYLILFVCVCV